jgi:hypothetical protein
LTGCVEDRLAGVQTDLRDFSGMEKIRGRKTGARGLQAEAGKAVEDDFGEAIEIADEEGEEADIERLLDQPRDDVLVARSAQKRPASVTSIAISVDDRNFTSPPSSPKPESM